MTRSYSPAPGAAPTVQRVRAQALMEARLILRNGEQLLLALLIPLIVLVGGVVAGSRFTFGSGRAAIDVMAPGVVALAVMSTSFTSLAISTGFERRYGVLKRLGATPLGRDGLLFGKVLSLLLVMLVQLLIIGAVAAAMGWRPELTGVALTVLLGGLGTAVFAGLALAMAGALRAEATLAAANLVYLILLVAGGVVLPSDSYGAWGEFVQWLPSAALGDGIRLACQDGALPGQQIIVLAVWVVLAVVAARKWFRWE